HEDSSPLRTSRRDRESPAGPARTIGHAPYNPSNPSTLPGRIANSPSRRAVRDRLQNALLAGVQHVSLPLQDQPVDQHNERALHERKEQAHRQAAAPVEPFENSLSQKRQQRGRLHERE